MWLDTGPCTKDKDLETDFLRSWSWSHADGLCLGLRSRGIGLAFFKLFSRPDIF